MRHIFTVLLLMHTLSLVPNNVNITNIKDAEKIVSSLQIEDKYQKELLDHYSELLIAMMYQESTYNTKTIGDSGKSVGALHIQKAFVDHINKISTKKFTYDDRLSVEKSIEMFLIYQEYYNKDRNLAIAAKIWNGGQNCDLNSYKVNNYWKAVQNHMSNKPTCYNKGKALMTSAYILAS